MTPMPIETGLKTVAVDSRALKWESGRLGEKGTNRKRPPCSQTRHPLPSSVLPASVVPLQPLGQNVRTIISSVRNIIVDKTQINVELGPTRFMRASEK